MAYSGEQGWEEGLVEAERVDEADSGTELLVKTDQPGAGGHLTARRALKAGIAGLLFAALAFVAVTYSVVPTNRRAAPSRGMVMSPDLDDLDNDAQRLFKLSANGTYGPKKLKLLDFLKDKCTRLGYEFYGVYCYQPCSNLTGGKYKIRTSPITCCEDEPCGVTNSLLDLKYRARVHLYRCKDGEEKYGGTCFKTCNVLTNGEFPYRTGADSCCKTKGVRCLLPGNSKISGDFSISGRNDTCKPDEEIHQKLCYKKCNILTNGTYPYRSAASTCCKKNDWTCISPFNADTNPKYSVGGGPNGDCPVGWEFNARFCYKTCASLTAGKFPHRVSGSGCCSTTGLACLLPSNLNSTLDNAKGGYFLTGGGAVAKGSIPDTPDVVSATDKTVEPTGLTTGPTGPMDRFR